MLTKPGIYAGRRTLPDDADLCQRDNDVALFVALLNVTVCRDDLLQRIAAVNHGSDAACFRQSLKECQVFIMAVMPYISLTHTTHERPQGIQQTTILPLGAGL